MLWCRTGGRNRWENLETCIRWEHSARLQRMIVGIRLPFFRFWFWAYIPLGREIESQKQAEASAVLDKVTPFSYVICGCLLGE